jgi:hypothetical protein
MLTLLLICHNVKRASVINKTALLRNIIGVQFYPCWDDGTPPSKTGVFDDGPLERKPMMRAHNPAMCL